LILSHLSFAAVETLETPHSQLQKQALEYKIIPDHQIKSKTEEE